MKRPVQASKLASTGQHAGFQTLASRNSGPPPSFSETVHLLSTSWDLLVRHASTELTAKFQARSTCGRRKMRMANPSHPITATCETVRPEARGLTAALNSSDIFDRIALL